MTKIIACAEGPSAVATDTTIDPLIVVPIGDRDGTSLSVALLLICAVLVVGAALLSVLAVRRRGAQARNR